MSGSHVDALKQLDEHLSMGNQSWLLGAGVSYAAGLPLMGGLTRRVLALANEKKHPQEKCLTEALATLPPDATIEQVLSHFADYLAIAARSRKEEVTIGKKTVKCNELQELLNQTLLWIGETIRWGYMEAVKDGSGKIMTPEKVGFPGQSIVAISGHTSFVNAVFDRGRAGLEDRRGAVRLFTTNYDTLIEDALSLCSIPYWDGYSGGAVAFRSHAFGQKEPTDGYRAHVVKLHGSIDWHIDDKNQIYRVRDGDLYPVRGSGRVLIYPQATKYLATQRDPFASLFELFRRALSSRTENVLAICGYSFGDEHINQEIELAMEKPNNKTTIVAFVSQPNDLLKTWRNRPWSSRLFLATETGLYVGDGGPFGAPKAGDKRQWWKFDGVTDLLLKGAEAYVA